MFLFCINTSNIVSSVDSNSHIRAICALSSCVCDYSGSLTACTYISTPIFMHRRLSYHLEKWVKKKSNSQMDRIYMRERDRIQANLHSHHRSRCSLAAFLWLYYYDFYDETRLRANEKYEKNNHAHSCKEKSHARILSANSKFSWLGGARENSQRVIVQKNIDWANWARNAMRCLHEMQNRARTHSPPLGGCTSNYEYKHDDVYIYI